MHAETPPAARAALRELERRLVRRRLTRLDPILRIELAALFGLIAAFVFWRARIPLDSLGRREGAIGVARAVGVISVALALIGAAIAAARHWRVLRRAPPGPPWLALPLPPRLIARHLSWNSRLHAWWVAVPAAGVFVACGGLLPIGWILLMAAAFLVLVLEASRLGCAVALGIARHGAEPRAVLDPVERLLAVAARPASRLALTPPVRWRRMSRWRAFAWKDLLMSVRPTAARRRLAAPLVLALLAVLAWALPRFLVRNRTPSDEGAQALALAHFAAFALTLAAVGTWGEFLTALCGEDPFAVLRSLPLELSVIWLSRMMWGVGFTLALELAHALAGRALEGPALALFIEWTGGAALAITMLAVNYGLTLYPRADAAQRMFALSLGLAIAASLMIPLAGWFVLLAGVLHSLRRLPRWPRLESLA
jgi:hypothetical protein